MKNETTKTRKTNKKLLCIKRTETEKETEKQKGKCINTLLFLSYVSSVSSHSLPFPLSLYSFPFLPSPFLLNSSPPSFSLSLSPGKVKRTYNQKGNLKIKKRT
jgi:hypothetical protein